LLASKQRHLLPYSLAVDTPAARPPPASPRFQIHTISRDASSSTAGRPALRPFSATAHQLEAFGDAPVPVRSAGRCAPACRFRPVFTRTARAPAPSSAHLSGRGPRRHQQRRRRHRNQRMSRLPYIGQQNQKTRRSKTPEPRDVLLERPFKPQPQLLAKLPASAAGSARRSADRRSRRSPRGMLGELKRERGVRHVSEPARSAAPPERLQAARGSPAPRPPAAASAVCARASASARATGSLRRAAPALARNTIAAPTKAIRTLSPQAPSPGVFPLRAASGAAARPVTTADHASARRPSRALEARSSPGRGALVEKNARVRAALQEARHPAANSRSARRGK